MLTQLRARILKAALSTHALADWLTRYAYGDACDLLAIADAAEHNADQAHAYVEVLEAEVESRDERVRELEATLDRTRYELMRERTARHRLELAVEQLGRGAT